METIRIERRADGVAIIWFDVPGQSVNTISPAVLAELEPGLDALLADGAVRAVVLASGKANGFIAGADLGVLGAVSTADQAEELSRRGNRMLARIADAKKPFVAAVHGPALGGGLEVALACHYILASDDTSTVLGLPEVTLGLLPGGGGTQRLPRRLGLAAALPLLLAGKRVRARRALRMGLVDALTTPLGIADTAARTALLLAERKLERPKRSKTMLDRYAGTGPGRRMVLERARREVERKTRGLYPAPRAILECIETGLAKGVAAGLAVESHLFGQLAAGHEARALIQMFHWMQELKKEASVDAPALRRVAVLGGGFMGAGIASVTLGRASVVLRDVAQEPLSRAARGVREGLEKQKRSGSITAAEADRRWSSLQLTTDLEALRGVDFVIEAVFEDVELKRRVLAEVEERVHPEAVFATNTSALPIADIAANARHPERVLGMHYFSPVPRMPLLELVVAERTAPFAVAAARALGAAQGKTVIAVKDGPGFYTTRILAPYLNEAMLLLEEGARVEELDLAMRDFGFPVGPIALLDEVGIDVGAHVSRDLGARFAERGGTPSGALERMRAAGFQGRKNGKGFYLYPRVEKKRAAKQPNPDAYAFFGRERSSVPQAEIQDRLALVLVNEAVRCLEETVIASARDGDVGAVLGLGFPPFIGGPFRYIDARGPDPVYGRLADLSARLGRRFEPALLLDELRRGGRRFHPR